MCDCIDNMEKLLKKDIDPEAEFTNLSFNLAGKEFLPPLEYSFRKKNIKGEFTKRVNKGYLMYLYCPFCGIKYGE